MSSTTTIKPLRNLLRSISTRSSASTAAACSRKLHTTSTRHATPTPVPQIDPEHLKDPKVQEFVTKVGGHQGCKDALLNLKTIYEQKGYSLTEKPSVIQMGKMAFDSDLRGAMTTLVSQIKSAGVNMELKDVAEMLQKMQQGQK